MLHHRTPTGSSAILRGNRHLSAVAVAILLATGLTASLLPGATSGAATSSGAPGIALGAYVQPAPVPGATNAAITHLDGGIGHSLAIFQTFSDWQTTTGASVPFPTVFATFVASTGATPMITWQPRATPGSGVPVTNQPNFSLVQVASGRYDAYIRSWADQARAFTKVVYVRLMHEMNGKWYPWGVTVNGNTPQQYVTAWQHIVGLVAGEGATNVRFVWCASTGARADPTPFFPGDAFTSWIALDGYNRWGPWRSFTSVFATRYAQITAISALPVMIAETASVENPLDSTAKASWITSAFSQEIPTAFPRVQAALYFDAPVGSSDQVLTSSPTAFQAFAQVAALPLYQAAAPG